MSNKKKVIVLPEWAQNRDKNVQERKFAKKLTENHLKYKRTIEEKTITISAGNSGTGKTCLAIEVAVQLFKAGKIDQIVLTRPLVECDEQLGFLPGNVEEKMAFFIAPLMGALSLHFNSHDLENLKKDQRILVMPLAQMRGNTFNKAFLCMDEAQNASYRQIEMFLTRIGDGTKAVINGDLKQSDIVRGIEDVPFLRAIRDLISKPQSTEIGLVVFGPNDVLRPDIVKIVTDKMGDENYNLNDLLDIFEDEVPSYGSTFKPISRKVKVAR